MSAPAILAKALFDNAPDELSFRKGDVIIVLEQDVDGLIDWWLCSLHGRQGIAPGNRLQQIKRRSDEQTSPEPPSQSSKVFTFEDLDYDVPRSQQVGEDYAVPRGIMSPDYDVPNANRPEGNENLAEIYDLPVNSLLRNEISSDQLGVDNSVDNYGLSAEVYGVPTALFDDSFSQEIYDIPSKDQGAVECADPSHTVDSSASQVSPVSFQASVGDGSDSTQSSRVTGEPDIYSEIYDVPSITSDEDAKKDNTGTSSKRGSDASELHKARTCGWLVCHSLRW